MVSGMAAAAHVLDSEQHNNVIPASPDPRVDPQDSRGCRTLAPTAAVDVLEFTAEKARARSESRTPCSATWPGHVTVARRYATWIMFVQGFWPKADVGQALTCDARRQAGTTQGP
jgi:hypothetical protein